MAALHDPNLVVAACTSIHNILIFARYSMIRHVSLRDRPRHKAAVGQTTSSLVVCFARNYMHVLTLAKRRKA